MTSGHLERWDISELFRKGVVLLLLFFVECFACVCTVCMLSDLGGPKDTMGPSELELQHWDLSLGPL